jgi:hypothetical protein
MLPATILYFLAIIPVFYMFSFCAQHTPYAGKDDMDIKIMSMLVSVLWPLLAVLFIFMVIKDSFKE